MLLPIRQKSTLNLALSPSMDQKLVWTVMFIDCRWTRVSSPYFPTDDRNVSKNALPYAYWNLTRKKKVGVLTTRDSPLVIYHVFNPVGTRFHRVNFLLVLAGWIPTAISILRTKELIYLFCIVWSIYLWIVLLLCSYVAISKHLPV